MSRIFWILAFWIFAGGAFRAHAAAPLCPAVDRETIISDRAPASASGAAKPVDTNGVTVIQVDPTFPVTGLREAGYTVKTVQEFYGGDRWQDPDVRLRNRLFREAGLASFVRGWGALEKDMLFLRAQEQTLDRLVFKYPKIPRTRLQSLQSMIEGEKAAER